VGIINKVNGTSGVLCKNELLGTWHFCQLIGYTKSRHNTQSVSAQLSQKKMKGVKYGKVEPVVTEWV
jgi:hypothetical protein